VGGGGGGVGQSLSISLAQGEGLGGGGCVPSPWFSTEDIFVFRTQSIVGEGEVPTPRAILTGTSNRNSWFPCCGTGIVLMQSGFGKVNIWHIYAYKVRLNQDF
jgi:hypothetical protein